MTQSVKHLTLGFGSGHDLVGCGIEAHVRLCPDSTEPAWDSLSSFLSVPSPCTLSLKINKLKKKIMSVSSEFKVTLPDGIQLPTNCSPSL